jgi:hypothetical protein
MDGAMTTAPLGKKVGENPTDRGRLGTKRSVRTDGRGVPPGLVIDSANRNDFTMACETIESLAVERPEPTCATPQGLCWTKAMTLTRSATSWRRLALRHTFVYEEKRRRHHD